MGYYLEQCNEHIEFTVKISTLGNPFGAMFGGAAEGSETEETREDGDYVDGYKVADEEDMEFLANVLSG